MIRDFVSGRPLDRGNAGSPVRACLSVRFQGLTSPPEYQPSAPSRLRPAKRAALCLPDPCGLGSDSHDGKVFSGKLLKSLTQTGSQRKAGPGVSLTDALGTKRPG